MAFICSVLNSEGTSYTVTDTVLNSAGTAFVVGGIVLDSDGNPFEVCTSTDTGGAHDGGDYVDEFVREYSLAELDDRMLLELVAKYMKRVI